MTGTPVASKKRTFTEAFESEEDSMLDESEPKQRRRVSKNKAVNVKPKTDEQLAADRRKKPNAVWMHSINERLRFGHEFVDGKIQKLVRSYLRTKPPATKKEWRRMLHSETVSARFPELLFNACVDPDSVDAARLKDLEPDDSLEYIFMYVKNNEDWPDR